MGFGPFVEGKTLVFLDEIQECPNFISFVQKG